MDKVALRHDRESVSSGLVPCGEYRNKGACRNQMRSANDSFVKGFTYELSTGKIFQQKWNQVVSDLIVGIIGVIVSLVGNTVMDITHPGDRRRSGSREQYLGEQIL